MDNEKKAQLPALSFDATTLRRMPMNKYCGIAMVQLFIWLAVGTAVAANQGSAIPASAAARAFSEAHELCTTENGELWDHSLCGPMIFADQTSRAAVLNEPVSEAVRDGAVWRITLPESMPLANTAVSYRGQRWSMIVWPLPKDETERDILLMHESYHRLAPALGLPAGSGMIGNKHLDTRKGRIWLRAEMHALRAALDNRGDVRKRALTDALLARVYRQSLWPQAAKQEQELELNEGLAHSTGIDAALHDRNARIEAAIEISKTSESAPSYVRSFAYATGPAYGELLNAADPDWRRRVTPAFDFGNATARAYGIALPLADEAAAKEALYRRDGKQIVAEESRRAQRAQVRNARYEEAFITGRTVTFPLINSAYSFDPRQVTQFDDHGSVYNAIHISDVWGEMNVESGGVLISSGFDRVTLPVARELTGNRLSGDGWSATLAKTFRLAPDPDKRESYVVVKK